MGASSSVVEDFNSIKGRIKKIIDRLQEDETNRINQLYVDLVQSLDVRMAFANFIWDRGMRNIEIRDVVLEINVAYVCFLFLQDSLEDGRDQTADILLYYLPLFAQSPVYEPFYRLSETPPLTRCPSLEDNIDAFVC